MERRIYLVPSQYCFREIRRKQGSLARALLANVPSFAAPPPVEVQMRPEISQRPRNLSETQKLLRKQGSLARALLERGGLRRPGLDG